MFIERPYQTNAANAAMEYIKAKKGNPIIVLPTGAGKTIVLVGLVDRYLSLNPRASVLILSDRKTILTQNHKSLEKTFGKIGLFSSGLGLSEICKITVAGIQSVHRKYKLFANFGLIIVDECHLVNTSKKGMYRNFLDNLKSSVAVGLTATHFRLGHGYIHEGDDAIFNGICFDMSSIDNFNQLVADGYLSKLYSKRTAMTMNVEGVRTIAGDFDQKQLAAAVCRDDITESAVLELVQFGENYKKWLIFAINILHAQHIRFELMQKGFKVGIVHSKMDGDFETEMKKYKNGEYRGMINVDMLTTGFDDPSIDLIAMMRPTSSPVLHVQSIGRGSRVVYAEGFDLQTKQGRLDAIEASGKTHCLVLDFAGNTRRLGPINDVKVKRKGDKIGSGGSCTKVCDFCGCDNHLSAKVCIVCDADFPIKEKLAPTAHNDDIVRSGESQRIEPFWVPVDSVKYNICKRNNKDVLQVLYFIDSRKIEQLIRLESTGWPGALAKKWVSRRLPKNTPTTISELYKRKGELPYPIEILLRPEGKYLNISDARFSGE